MNGADEFLHRRARTVDFVLGPQYIKNSLKFDSPEMNIIRRSAAKNAIDVLLGYSENDSNSVYIVQCLISGRDGEIKMRRPKVKPTHMERTVFGDGSGNSLKNVVGTDIGRVGALSCWEHTQPLLKYHTYLQREEIHVAAWPPLDPHPGGPALWSMSKEGQFCVVQIDFRYLQLGRRPDFMAGCQSLSQTYAVESAAFVLHCTSVLTQKGIDAMGTAGSPLFNAPGGGCSAVFGPQLVCI